MRAKKKNDDVDEWLRQLSEAQAERDRFSKDAATYKRLYESQQGYNKTIGEQLRHAERQVRALLDALTDKYQPIPTEIKVSMDYRIADQKEKNQ